MSDQRRHLVSAGLSGGVAEGGTGRRPHVRPAGGEAGGFNVVQKLLTVQIRQGSVKDQVSQGKIRLSVSVCPLAGVALYGPLLRSVTGTGPMTGYGVTVGSVALREGWREVAEGLRKLAASPTP